MFLHASPLCLQPKTEKCLPKQFFNYLVNVNINYNINVNILSSRQGKLIVFLSGRQYKLLGVILTDDLKWKDHVAYIYGKACKRLYYLRILRKAGVETDKMLKVYSAIIRPILEYAVPVWQAILGVSLTQN